MKADYVIIGAGSAGCVLANRLTADPNVRVLLIEAGGRDWSPYIHIPAGFMKLLDHPALTWGYRAEPDPGTNGRAILYPRGRVLGGSSSINGLIYVRGQPEDFDHWAQLGNRGWGWDDVLPYFKKAENWEGGETEIHGKGGPLSTAKMDRSPLCAAVVEAGKEIGLAYREDVNDLPAGAGDAIAWCQQTRGGRRRATCKMGSDQLAVVDDRLRVHGLQGLWVIDASVMPNVTSTNTNAPTIMIAERGAELIRRAAREAAPAPTIRAA